MAERLQELLRMMREAGIGDSDDSDDGDDGSSDSSRARSDSNSSSESSSSGCRPQVDRSFASLKESVQEFMRQPERPLRAGDIVMWKEGCANRKRPRLDEPAVVIEILPEPIYGEEKSSGSPYFHEPLDMVLGMLDKDGDLTRYVFDKRRFRLATQPDEIADQSPLGNLRKLAVEFSRPLTLHVGDVVMLKPGLRHRRIPDYNTIAVVAEVLREPYRDLNAEEGTSSFYEQISGRIGFLDSDGDISFLYVDLRRYRKVN